MFKIDLINVQAIGEAHIVMEDNTINVFTGNNSNGKSIVSKVIEYLSKGDLIHKDVREALIKDSAEQAVVLMTLGSRQLGLVLTRELNKSVVMLVPDLARENEQGGRIVRPLSDSKGVELMVREFGLRTYNNGEICLQLAPTFGPIPMVTTSGKTNNDMVDDITIDKVADEFLSSFANITFPTFKERKKRLSRDIEKYDMLLKNMEQYDWKKYDEIYNEMDRLYSLMRGWSDLDIENIPLPLEVVVVPDLEIENIPLPLPEYFSYAEYIPNIEKELDDLIALEQGVCPTCRRPWFEHN